MIPMLQKFKKLLEKIKRRRYYNQLKIRSPHEYKLFELKYKGAQIGENCLIMSSVTVADPVLVTIGNNVIISGYSYLLTHDGSSAIFYEAKDKFVYGKIKIGHNVFIGIGSILLPGVEIGDNVIVGAGSVVRGKIPNNSVVMGNPAKIVFKTSVAKKLLINHRNLLQSDILLTDYEQDVMLIEHFKISRKHFQKEFYLLDKCIQRKEK